MVGEKYENGQIFRRIRNASKTKITSAQFLLKNRITIPFSMTRQRKGASSKNVHLNIRVFSGKQHCWPFLSIQKHQAEIWNLYQGFWSIRILNQSFPLYDQNWLLSLWKLRVCRHAKRNFLKYYVNTLNAIFYVFKKC